MKTTTRPDVRITTQELAAITTQVKETLAFGYIKQHRIFSAVDLWNIQKHKKYISPRRYML
jgi:hypothetical protein